VRDFEQVWAYVLEVVICQCDRVIREHDLTIGQTGIKWKSNFPTPPGTVPGRRYWSTTVHRPPYREQHQILLWQFAVRTIPSFRTKRYLPVLLPALPLVDITAIMSAEEIAQAFTQHYYTTFDTNVAGLASMFVSHGTVPTTYGSLSMDFSRVTTTFHVDLY
jgi:hypothetical protein